MSDKNKPAESTELSEAVKTGTSAETDTVKKTDTDSVDAGTTVKADTADNAYISEDAEEDSAKTGGSSEKSERSSETEAKNKIEPPKKSWFEKLVSILLWTIVGIIVFLIGTRCYFRIPVHSYYKYSDRTFKIPDSGDGFIAQGISFDKVGGRFLLTGYKKDKSASPIYVINSSNKLVQTVTMADTNGMPLTIHAGGLSVFGDYVYVTGDGNSLWVFDYGKIMTAADGASVSAVGEIQIPEIRTAWTTINNNYLIIGEFHKETKYTTIDSHKLTTPAGDRNEAIAVAFKLSDNAEFGLETTPAFAFSITDKVQGMAINDGKLYLSTSYAAAFSKIYVYDLLNTEASSATITYAGTQIPLTYCDSDNLVAELKIAPMSEEIEFVDGMMYTMCESASDKYIFGKLTGASKVYATNMDEFIAAEKQKALEKAEKAEKKAAEKAEKEAAKEAEKAAKEAEKAADQN